MVTITFQVPYGTMEYQCIRVHTRSRRVARVAAKAVGGWAHMRGRLVTRRCWMDEAPGLPRMVLGRERGNGND